MSKPTNVVLKRGTHATETTWDVLQIIHQYKDASGSMIRPDDYITFARRPDDTVVRRINITPEEWEIITDEEQLRVIREQFDTGDRLSAEQREKGASSR